MLGARVDDHQTKPGRSDPERDLAGDTSVVAVQQRVAGHRPQRTGLIHPAGRRTRYFMLGAHAPTSLAGAARIVLPPAELVGVIESQRHRALNGSGGGQAGADRQAGVDGRVESTKSLSGLADGPERAGSCAVSYKAWAWISTSSSTCKECECKPAVSSRRPERTTPSRVQAGHLPSPVWSTDIWTVTW
jgi:hypothetical protein